MKKTKINKGFCIFFSDFLYIITVPLLGMALASMTINPLLIVTLPAGILSFGMACIGIERLSDFANGTQVKQS